MLTQADPLPSHTSDETRMRALHYFNVAKLRESLWRWDPEAKQVIWADDTSIASVDEIVAVLDRLASRGLPRFGAIVHLFAAMRGKSINL